jgi:hypothetical protein
MLCTNDWVLNLISYLIVIPFWFLGIGWVGGWAMKQMQRQIAEREAGPGRVVLDDAYYLAAWIAGKLSFMARATNRIGQTQTAELISNPAGYNNNVMQNCDAECHVRG